MGFLGSLFNSGVSFTQKPGSGQIVNSLENFNPLQYLDSPDIVEKDYRRGFRDLMNPMKDPTKNPLTMQGLNQINSSFAGQNRQAENLLTSGSGALGDQDLARDKAAEIVGRSGNAEAQDKSNLVTNARQEAAQGFEGAKGQRYNEALRAGQEKENALSNAGNINNNSFVATQNPSLFSDLTNLAGVAAAPFTGGLSALAAGGAGGTPVDNGTGGEYGAQAADQGNTWLNSLSPAASTSGAGGSLGGSMGFDLSGIGSADDGSSDGMNNIFNPRRPPNGLSGFGAGLPTMDTTY